MEIKSKIEENIPIQGNNIQVPENNSLNNTGNSSFNTGLPDFKACLKELDDDKNNINQIGNNSQNNVQGLMQQQKNTEINKTLNKLTEKENIPVKIKNSDDIKLFMSKKGNFKFLDNDTKINFDSLKKKDIDFLRTSLENPNVTLNNLNFQNLQANLSVQNSSGQVSYKSLDVSKGLFSLIEYSFKAQKPVRLDFNGNSSVILKMNNDGKLIAEFISNDKAMEYVLKSSIPGLKDKLDAEGIPYEEILYKDNSKNENKKQNQGGNQ